MAKESSTGKTNTTSEKKNVAKGARNKMPEIIRKNADFLKERRRGVRAASVLFWYLVENCDELNALNKTKAEISDDLTVTPRTVCNWLKTLAGCGVIKYKYSGSTRLNPEIYYTGTTA